MVPALTREGNGIHTTWQVVDVSRPLMSVHQICERDNIVVFGKGGGYIMSLVDGTMTHFGVEDNVYVLELMLPPNPADGEGFRWQGR